MAAVDWALRRGDPQQRSTALASAAGVWAQRDAAAAARWARGAPTDVRDAAVQAVLGGMAAGGTVDRALFAALSSDRAREQAAVRVAPGIARSDAAQARALVDTFIKDANLRRSVEQQIERLSGQSPTDGVIIFREPLAASR